MRIRKFNESLDNEIIKTKGILLKNSVPVTNNVEILQYMVDIQMDSYKNSKKSLKIAMKAYFNKIIENMQKRV
jgi:hypothetical protein